MTENEIKAINETLPENGRLFWWNNKGWTSPLWDDLVGQGFYSMSSPSGYVTAYSKDGKELASGLGRVGMLVAVARAMR
jgi:hypothetical protein